MEIEINGKKFIYTPEDLSYESAICLDKKIAKKNLLDFKTISDKNHLNLILSFGTLLGAIREHDFITHDIDIDLITSDEDRLLDIIPILQNIGFRFVRFETSEKKSTIYSFKRDTVYIDVYIAYRFNRKYYYLLSRKTKAAYITKLIPYDFLNTSFFIPKYYRRILVELYGKDWYIPIKNKPGDFYDHDKKVIKFLKRIIPKELQHHLKQLGLLKKLKLVQNREKGTNRIE
jgi:phosphorylcholine metabolism protein LicD